MAFLRMPRNVCMSSPRLLASATVGLRSQASTSPTTIPAPMVGFSDVMGEAMNAVTTEMSFAPAMALKSAIEVDLDAVPNLDDDTIIRRFLNLIEATLRTNHYRPKADETVRSLALKFDSRAITGLPQPRPWREIFVYGPEVEGVHLRFGPVARGGLRWKPVFFFWKPCANFYFVCFCRPRLDSRERNRRKYSYWEWG